MPTHTRRRSTAHARALLPDLRSLALARARSLARSSFALAPLPPRRTRRLPPQLRARSERARRSERGVARRKTEMEWKRERERVRTGREKSAQRARAHVRLSRADTSLLLLYSHGAYVCTCVCDAYTCKCGLQPLRVQRACTIYKIVTAAARPLVCNVSLPLSLSFYLLVSFFARCNCLPRSP